MFVKMCGLQCNYSICFCLTICMHFSLTVKMYMHIVCDFSLLRQLYKFLTLAISSHDWRKLVSFTIYFQVDFNNCTLCKCAILLHGEIWYFSKLDTVWYTDHWPGKACRNKHCPHWSRSRLDLWSLQIVGKLYLGKECCVIANE